MNFKQQNLFERRTYNTAVREMKIGICEAISDAGISREQALDLVNELAQAYGVRLVKGNGPKVTIETWEKWLNPQDETRVPPAKALPVICAALGSIKPLAALAELAGGRMIDEKDAMLLDWGRAYHKARSARIEMKKLEDSL